MLPSFNMQISRGASILIGREQQKSSGNNDYLCYQL